MRKQLQSERKRVENALESQKVRCLLVITEATLNGMHWTNKLFSCLKKFHRSVPVARAGVVITVLPVEARG